MKRIYLWFGELIGINTVAIEGRNKSRKGEDNKPAPSESGPKVSDDPGLRFLLGLMVFGLLAIFFVCIMECCNPQYILKNIGLALIIALASALCGGFMGFLFGIPRSLQRTDNEKPPIETPDKNGKDNNGSNNSVRERPYSNNTNLEQISDWLTKIIVGVGLTQFRGIQAQFNTTVTCLSSGFLGALHSNTGFAFTSAVMVFYSLCGFLGVYLWAKIYLLQLLFATEASLDGLLHGIIKKFEKKSEEQSLKLEAYDLATKLTEFNKQKDKVFNSESKDGIPALLAIAKPQPVFWLDDCQKDRWDGRAESAGLKLSATYEKNSREEIYDVTFTVEPTVATAILTGTVYFFLHDSYYPECIMTATVVENRASIHISSYQAFTVGAVCNGGTVKLELDANLDPTAPPDYTYSDALINYDEIVQRLDKLKNNQAGNSASDIG